jgi:hypothetical protein
MGAWGADSFENDDASDWLADFCEGPDTELTSVALSTVAEMAAADYLEAPDCSVGIAAAEVVAARKGAPNASLDDDAKTCLASLENNADPGLVSLALKAIERIKTNSELKELWDESENPAEWYQAVENLEARLKA